MHITSATVIIPVVATATDPMHVTVMRVDPIPTTITGATVYVTMVMLDITVQRIIHIQLPQIATIHVQEAVMDLRCMTVSAVLTTRTWMHMDTVHARMVTTETTAIKLMTQVITTITSIMPTQHLTLTTSTDTLEIITTIMDTLEIVILPAMVVQAPMHQTVQAVALTPTLMAVTVDVTMATTDMTALVHTLSEEYISLVTVIIPAAETVTVLMLVTAISAVAIPIWITGVTVYVMTDMLVLIVVSTILILMIYQLATIHVQVAVMDLRCMTV